MKKLLALLLTLIMAVSVVAVAPTVSAESSVYKSNYCCYTLDKKGYATVIDFYNYKGICKKYGSYWKIPSKLRGHTVKKIILDMDYDKCPENEFPFKKVRIPKTVTYIKNLAKYIRERGYDHEWYYNTGVYNSLIVCDEGSRAESYARQCGLDYSIKGNIYGDIAYLGTYGFKYNIDKKYRNSKGYLYMKFNGKERNIKFTISRGKQVLKPNRDYTVKYVNNINPGKAYAMIIGKGKFYGVSCLDYDIKPTKPKVTVHQSESYTYAYFDNILYEANCGEYIGQYSETSDFKKHKTFGWNNKLSDLKKGKTYYFRCRFKTHGVAYHIDFYTGRNIKYSQITFASYYYPQYSSWSDVKAVKIKYDYSNKQ